MELLQKILQCENDDELNKIIKNEITIKNDSTTKVGNLGFTNGFNGNDLYRGFIPLDTRIKYSNLALEDYKMDTTDYFYEFAKFVKKNNISNQSGLVHSLEYFINNYFGYPGKASRETIFNDIAWQTTETDEEYFKALENNSIGDLKGKGAAECTERGAVAQQILNLFGADVYYCMGCVDLGDRQEAHCFNIIKRKNDYALLDYSIPVASFNQDGKVRTYLPFVGEMTNEEFENFVNNGTLKSFNNYEYINGNEKVILNQDRAYVVGSYEINKNKER